MATEATERPMCEWMSCTNTFKPRKGKHYCSPTCRYRAWELRKASENMPPSIVRIFARMDTRTKRSLINALEASIEEEAAVG